MADQGTYLGISAAAWAKVLRSSNPLERRLAAYALGEAGPEAREAKAALSAALEDPVAYVRVWAAAALTRLDPSLGEPIAALTVAMKDETDFVRSLAAWHLGRLGPEFPHIEESLPAIKELLHDPNSNVRTEATMALRNLEGKGAPPLELLHLCHAVSSPLGAVLPG